MSTLGVGRKNRDLLEDSSMTRFNLPSLAGSEKFPVTIHNSASDDEFVRRITHCQRELRTFIIGLTPTQADADDVLQEVNLALWKKRHLYDPQQEFLRWAFGFAALEVRSYRSRSAKDRLWFSDSAIALLAEEWPKSISFMDDCREALATCLQKLRGAERQVIEAKYGSHKSVRQIATETSRPPSTVYKILRRAVESLRACVKRTQLQANR